MAESILTSVKHVLGIEDDETEFDLDITMHINSVFSTLHQLGVGPANGFMLEPGATAKSALWSDFIGTTPTMNSVKSYVYLAVRLIFDPPPNSFTVTALENQKKELEWRLNVAAESNLIPTPAPNPVDGNFYDITGQEDFPDTAPVGAYGVDFETGDVWRNQ